jgi:hypothetical protein
MLTCGFDVLLRKVILSVTHEQVEVQVNSRWAIPNRAIFSLDRSVTFANIQKCCVLLAV